MKPSSLASRHFTRRAATITLALMTVHAADAADAADAAVDALRAHTSQEKVPLIQSLRELTQFESRSRGPEELDKIARYLRNRLAALEPRFKSSSRTPPRFTAFPTHLQRLPSWFAAPSPAPARSPCS
jgi:hypothetical protein